MSTEVTIGDFARMTHLTVKTLRHYHHLGLLEPVEVDPRTGYRYYSTDQVPAAQVIRRFRQLDMPLDEVRAVLQAPDDRTRHQLIAAHLDRLENQLRHTEAAVQSLRGLLDPSGRPAPIEHRSVPSLEAIAIRATVEPDEVGPWWTAGLAELRATATGQGWPATGPAGGLYASALFEGERGEAMLYLPVAGAEQGSLPPTGRVQSTLVPGSELAVVVHRGSEESIDLAYGALGVYVTEHGLAGPGPIREAYLVDSVDTSDPEQWRTEVGWPIVTERTTKGR